MRTVDYVGPADTRIITAEQLAAAGFVSPTLTWNKANSYEVDVDDDLLAAYLIAVDANLKFEPADTFGDAVSAYLGFNPILLQDLPALARPFAGTELMALEAGGGIAVRSTLAQIGPSPVEVMASHDRNRSRIASDFDEFPSGTTITTDLTLITGTKFRTSFVGTGASVVQSQGIGDAGILDISTGTTATGKAAVVPHHGVLSLFSNTARYGWGCRLRMPTVSDGTNTYQVIMGITDPTAAGAAPTRGFMFRSPTAAGNWRAVTREGGADLASVDTGVATDAAAFHDFAIIYENSECKWYIDGVNVHTEATLEPTALQNLGPLGVGIHKSVGTTARVLRVDRLSQDIPAAVSWGRLP